MIRSVCHFIGYKHYRRGEVKMSVSQMNIDVFRMINNLGNQYSFLNPIAIFFAEYMLYILALGMVIYWFTRTKQNRMMIIQAVIAFIFARSEEHTSELQSRGHLVCRLLLEKNN